MMERVCMFCKTVYGYKPGRGCEGQTHGICPACEPRALELLEECSAEEGFALSERGRVAAGLTV